MNYGPRQIERAGRTLTLRSPGAEDGAALLDFLRAVYGETDYMLSYPDEVADTEKDEARLLERWRGSETELMIAAFDGARVVATATVAAAGNKSKVRHRAALGITVRREFWGLGLGRLLMRELEAAAPGMGFLQIELGVFSDNARAIRLYETEGYTAYGTVPRAFRQRDGAFRDELLMVKALGAAE